MNFKIPEALQKVRIDFLLKEGFLGHFMSYRPDDFSDQVPSAGTDGNKTLWNPVWFDSLTSAEKEGVKRHETKHDLYEHSLRLSERPDFYTNRRQANVAMDVIINAECIAESVQLYIQGNPCLDIKSCIITIFHVSILEQLFPRPVICLV